MVASGALGLARRAFDEARNYAITRKTMGKPIGEHQAVSFILADMAIGYEAAKVKIRERERESMERVRVCPYIKILTLEYDF